MRPGDHRAVRCNFIWKGGQGDDEYDTAAIYEADWRGRGGIGIGRGGHYR